MRHLAEVRRRQILEVALRMFSERGYEGTPLSAVAEEVGLSKAGIVHHFPHKDDILQALFQPLFEEVEELLEGGPGREELLEGYLEVMLRNRRLTVLLATDLAILNRPRIGERVCALNLRLRAALAGSGAGLEEQMRAECALGALRSPVIFFPGADPGPVRRVSLESARRVLGFGGPA
ncbi:TetR family transcriptional regulator [Rubrobacter xylanophilus]|uniref:TetR family transcriptional regulator n=1 Tax=Rubrobacter xylanophilus TaxID=49319 RepID=A0A510HJY9_9ACTN|nr:TetR/AcrR family transcriptional regulator [Rubrobacter xylanophilus]BBL80339.1 TetR family transcriptional regulator [Rubrobacter xylanophilus]